MTAKTEQLAKSRLGRLLVNRGYITEDQLDEALRLQASKSLMLGEVLLSQGWITEKDLKRTLKHQSRYRYTAAFIALAAAPFQPMLAVAATPMGIPVVNNKVEISAADMGKFSGMQMMDDEEMSGVNAQGFGGSIPGISTGISFGKNGDVAGGFMHKYNDDDYEEPKDEQIAYEITDTVLTMAGLGPISNLIEADISIEGLKHKEGRAQIEILEGGKMKFYMPTEIERISMENIRVKGNTSGATFGSIYISDVKYNPDSSYTISAK
tara:strand:+ start:362 stop:1159 length:798 start_codon:yes stop_codon:yes gene_type:complete